jgi:hypothetical protein
MMYDNMTIGEAVEMLEKTARTEAQNYLGSEMVHGVKQFAEGDRHVIEAFIVERQETLYMPYWEIGENGVIFDSHCQCCEDEELCIHKLALLLAAQVMSATDEDDYHMASKRKTAQTLEKILSIGQKPPSTNKPC